MTYYRLSEGRSSRGRGIGHRLGDGTLKLILGYKAVYPRTVYRRAIALVSEAVPWSNTLPSSHDDRDDIHIEFRPMGFCPRPIASVEI